MKVQPPPRPYTEYNIFFQIERECVLQNLGVTPTLRAEEIFVISDTNYDGPDLPLRYEDVILPSDWYIPGKAHRKKRQHRATHGKISFTDLSKNIASSWRNIDGETKLFCAQVSDIGVQKYKREMQRHKSLTQEQSEPNSTKVNSELKAQKKSSAKHSQLTKMEAPKTGLVTNPKHHVNTTQHATSTRYPNIFNENDLFIERSRSEPLIQPDFPTSYASSATVNSAWTMQTYTCGLCAKEAPARPRERSESCGHVDLHDDDIIDMYMKSD
eukprot:CAMPEP_0172313852 /NCGR_PEP_ID=MMETSP1058-20130122/21126_1 /TAXON_ID=83371 /ORGANISM="Detonula confervacea, Strain CCMP 353" /LENGTH=269 /DNA_ID=CAMNT_0013027575 /DNA_START=14 /DNA_END=823 /DNA_ORIENTATION=-